MSHEYVLVGIPVAWKRARMNNGRFYDAQKHEKLCTQSELSMQHDGIRPYNGPVKMEVIFYFPLPKLSAKNLEKKIETPHFVRPDLDNCCKYLLDAATGILFKDDAIITSLSACKRYDKVPRTVFTLTELCV